MLWKQFFTPVESMDATQAKKFIDQNPQGSVTILDVRQPREYAESHIPGAKLIPLAEIRDRMDELDPERQTVVYCAIGGRSRVAAQMLSANGLKKVYNLTGGIKAWNGNIAHGPVDQGLELFHGKESVEEVLIVAYSLEKGLREFYQQMATKTRVQPVRELFHKLFSIEINHQNRLLHEYNRITGKSFENAGFDAEIVAPAVEGGLSTDDFLRLFGTDLNSTTEVVGMAMSIEAQALDMYHRASENAKEPKSREVLHQIALEEHEHLKLLGELFEQL